MAAPRAAPVVWASPTSHRVATSASQPLLFLPSWADQTDRSFSSVTTVVKEDTGTICGTSLGTPTEDNLPWPARLFEGSSTDGQLTPRSRRATSKCEASTTETCPACRRKIPSAKMAQHQDRCSAISEAREERERRLCKEAADAERLRLCKINSGSLAAQFQRVSWADVQPPNSARGPETKYCPSCQRQVLASSFRQHHYRCWEMNSSPNSWGAQQRSVSPLKTRPASPTNRYRRATWSDTESPSKSAPVPETRRCPHCSRQMMVSSFEHHVVRCQQMAAEKAASMEGKLHSASVAKLSPYRRTVWRDVSPSRLASPPRSRRASPPGRDITPPCSPRASQPSRDQTPPCSPLASQQFRGQSPPRSPRASQPSCGQTPTEQCPNCLRFVSVSCLPAHRLRCQHWVDAREQMLRPAKSATSLSRSVSPFRRAIATIPTLGKREREEKVAAPGISKPVPCPSISMAQAAKQVLAGEAEAARDGDTGGCAA
eukprot:gb/GFBE01039233.1/.p1 GENE.gb/GFBE01039233.1/~~gb/GFBE01039233.1/.p1  ORF type:complete len:487 (+),score=44.45 gb/GFBE01039233.1/:1-1461(+)